MLRKIPKPPHKTPRLKIINIKEPTDIAQLLYKLLFFFILLTSQTTHL